MIYQWENMLRFMQINFNAANLPTVKIGNFRAVLKETVLSASSANIDGYPYSFEIVLNYPNREKSFFWSNLKQIPISKIMEIDLFFRLKIPKDNKFYNDRTSLKKLLPFFPELENKVAQEDIQYSDLVNLASTMFSSFKANYVNPDALGRAPSVNSLSFFVREGLAKAFQTQNSSIGNVSEKYNESRFPILLYRKTMTVNPMRLAVIMLPSADTIEFYVYSLDSNVECSKVVSVADCESSFPFLKILLPQPGMREEIGDRLFSTFKNTLLMELYIKEDLIRKTQKVGIRDTGTSKQHKFTMIRGEKIKL
jgi:hypothetical protein